MWQGCDDDNLPHVTFFLYHQKEKVKHRMIRVIFVCLGNICRSPMAEAVFSRMVAEAGLSEQIVVDSAGTGSWHVGEMAHRGTRRVLQEHGIDYTGRARQVTAEDVATETYVVAMDQSNVNELKRRFGRELHVYRLLDFVRESDSRDVPDPYYNGNFEHVYQLIEAGCYGLLEMIREEEGV